MRSRGLKDDTTCIVVDIIPLDHYAHPPPLPPPTPKRLSKLRSFLSGKLSLDSANKLSSDGIVEELFEEGSAMLAERFV